MVVAVVVVEVSLLVSNLLISIQRPLTISEFEHSPVDSVRHVWILHNIIFYILYYHCKPKKNYSHSQTIIIYDFPSHRNALLSVVSLISLLLIAVLVIYEFMYYMQLNRIDRLFVDTSEQKKLPIYLNITFPGVPCSALSIDVMDVSGEHQIGIEHTIFKQRLDKHGNMISESMEQADLNHASHHRDEEDNGKKMKRDALQKKMQAQDYCGSCYGAESSPEECCNTCQQVREAYRRKGWAFKSDLDIEQCFDDVQERVSNYAKDEGCYMSGYFLVNKVAGVSSPMSNVW